MSALFEAERYWEIDTFCEEALLESGLVEEAYRRYGLDANRAELGGVADD